MEEVGIASVADAPLAIDALFVEAQRHRVQRAEAGRTEIVHLLRRLGLQQRATIFEMRDHELRHVRPAYGEAARRFRNNDFERLGRSVHLLVAARGEGPEPVWQRLPRAGIAHAERAEYLRFDVGMVWRAAHPLNDIACQRGGVVGIGGGRARREHACRQRFANILVERQQIVRIAGDQVPDRFLETRSVGHDLAQRDRLALIGWDLEIEIFIDVGIEIQPPRFDLLHHRGPGEQFGDRTDAEQRGVGVHRLALGEVGVAIALVRQNFAVLHNGHHRPRNVAIRQSIGHKAIEPGPHIRGSHRDSLPIGRSGGRPRLGCIRQSRLRSQSC